MHAYSLQYKTWPYLTFLFILTVIFTAMFWILPPMLDDWWFLRYMDRFSASPSWNNFFDDSVEAFNFRINFDNGRFPNLFGSPIMLIPKWIRALFLGLSFGASLYFGSRVSDTWKKSPIGFSVLAACFVFLLPWYDSMYITMFALNYVVPSAIMLGIAWLIFCRKPLRNPIYCLLIACFCGWWHEAFTAMAIGGLVGVLLCFKEYRRTDVFCWLFGFIIAFAFIYFVPATSYKAGGMMNVANYFNLRLGFGLGFPFYIFIIFLTTALVFSKTRKLAYTPVMAFITGGAVAGFVIWRMFMTGYRTAWPMLLMSSLGIAYIVRLICTGRTKVYNILAICIALFVVLQQALTLPWFVKFNSEVRQANETAAKLKDDQVAFIKLTTEHSAPLYTLNRPNFGLYQSSGFPSDKVFPEELRDFSPEKAISIGVGCDAYLYKNIIVIDNLDENTSWDANIFFDGKPYLTTVGCCMFSNDSGRHYYILTGHVFDKSHFHSITGIELIQKREW